MHRWCILRLADGDHSHPVGCCAMAPIGDLDALRAELLRRLDDAIRSRLTPMEIDFLDGIAGGPDLRLAPDDDGGAIYLRFFGHHTEVGWDGTTAHAYEQI